jgi:hypothetical protein
LDGVSDEEPRDLEETGSAFREQTVEELEQLALSRAAATGKVVVVSAFTGSDRATVYDGTEEGAEAVGEVPVLEPSPSLAYRLQARERRRAREQEDESRE